MSSRDAILQRIRIELTQGPTVEPPPVPEVWPCESPSTAQMIQRFTSELETVTGEVIRCDSIRQAAKQLAELADNEGWSQVAAVDRPDCREATAALASERVVFAPDDWGPKEMGELPVGVLDCDYLVADTGTCVVECNTPAERLMCYLPPTSVVVARVGGLREHLPAAWEEIAGRTAEPDRRGEFVLITGPSRTADIEKILILGVHGPKRLVVLLVG